MNMSKLYQEARGREKLPEGDKDASDIKQQALYGDWFNHAETQDFLEKLRGMREDALKLLIEYGKSCDDPKLVIRTASKITTIEDILKYATRSTK